MSCEAIDQFSGPIPGSTTDLISDHTIKEGVKVNKNDLVAKLSLDAAGLSKADAGRKRWTLCLIAVTDSVLKGGQ